MMRRILLFTTHFYPGFRAGGILKACVRLVNNISNDFIFTVITSNTDLGSDDVYFEAVPNINKFRRNVLVVYLDNSIRSILGFLFSKKKKYDIIHVNSFFCFKFSLFPVLLWKIGFWPNTHLLLSVHGEFSPGALKIKNFKKSLFIKLVKCMRLYNAIYWHATSELERDCIIDVFPNSAKRIIIAPYFINEDFDILFQKRNQREIDRNVGPLEIVFLSRLTVKKNLIFLLEILHEIKSKVNLTIIGPIEDVKYWNKCETLINSLPENVNSTYKGEIEPINITTEFSKYDLFVFPTLGENFGYVILESLVSGTSVLLSDTTPWIKCDKELAVEIIPLSNKNLWIEKIDGWSSKSQNDLKVCREQTQIYLKKNYSMDSIFKKNKQMYLHLIQSV